MTEDYETVIAGAEAGLAEVEASLVNEHEKRERYLKRSDEALLVLEAKKAEAERVLAEARLQPVVDEVNGIREEAYLVAEQLVEKPYLLTLQRELTNLRDRGVLALAPHYEHGVPGFLPFQMVHQAIENLLSPSHQQRRYYADELHVFGFHNEHGERVKLAPRGELIVLVPNGVE